MLILKTKLQVKSNNNLTNLCAIEYSVYHNQERYSVVYVEDKKLS